MQFNTLTFFCFFAIVFLLYVVLKRKWQNVLLLIASYVFYSFWDWRFLIIILVSSAFNFFIGILIHGCDDTAKRRKYFIASIVFNLGVLFFFKYFDFFSYNLKLLLWSFGLHINLSTLNIILPLGISFYTFQAMSYPIDIYRKTLSPTKNYLDFSLFIAFFPQLVAGPIERARNLLPQFEKNRQVTFNNIKEGGWLIFWGLFKKIVIADNLARTTSLVFDSSQVFYGPILIMASYAYAIQIYADFSGYSNMARGLAKLLGIDIMVNFRFPFFSSNPYDFWQRWHISLTTWIKEYVFYPLAVMKDKGRKLKPYAIILLTWSIMGFWHGAAWRFIVWGIYHGLIVIIYSRIRPYLIRTKRQGTVMGFFLLAASKFFIFNLFSFGILFFAMESVGGVFGFVNRIFMNADFFNLAQLDAWIIFLVIVSPLFVMESFQFRNNNEFAVLKTPVAVRAIVFLLLFYAITLYGDFNAETYFYFQF